MLKVNFLHICDSVIIDKMTGKASIIGIFENINGVSFPAIYPIMSLAVGFEGEPGDYDIELVFLDEVGEILKISPVKIKIGSNKKGNWVHNIVPYQIPRELTQKILLKYKDKDIYTGFITINNK